MSTSQRVRNAVGLLLSSGEVELIDVLDGALCTTTEVEDHDPLRVAVEASGFGASTAGHSATNVILADIPSAVLVTNFFVGSLPLTGAELSLVGLWLGLALLVGGAVVVIVHLRRRRNPIPSEE